MKHTQSIIGISNICKHVLLAYAVCI